MENNHETSQPSSKASIKQQLEPDFFQAIAIRDNGGNPQVYMHQPTHKMYDFAGTWIIPRSLYGQGERDGEVALRLEKDFGGVRISNFVFIGYRPHPISIYPISVIFLIELEEDPPTDHRHRWFPVNDLPLTMLRSHFEYIQSAFAAYNRLTNK